MTGSRVGWVSGRRDKEAGSRRRLAFKAGGAVKERRKKRARER